MEEECKFCNNTGICYYIDVEELPLGETVLKRESKYAHFVICKFCNFMKTKLN